MQCLSAVGPKQGQRRPTWYKKSRRLCCTWEACARSTGHQDCVTDRRCQLTSRCFVGFSQPSVVSRFVVALMSSVVHY